MQSESTSESTGSKYLVLRTSDEFRMRFDMLWAALHAWGMHSMQFEQSVQKIVRRDSRYHPQAYLFLRDALDFTLKRIIEQQDGHARHVSGPELLDGFRDLALHEFGPMASTLMREWGVCECSDVGEMVFHLIDEQIFGKQDSDQREDFSGDFDLLDALHTPFLPRKRLEPIA